MEVESVIVREAFIIPVFKILLSQIILGNIYFALINFFGIESLTADILLFNFLEGTQVLISIFIFLAWYNHYYSVSNEEIEINMGAILQKKSAYSLEHLESVSCRKTFNGLLFNYGNVKMSLHYGTDSKIITIKNIRDPQKYADFLNQKLKKNNQHSGNLFK